MLRSLSIRDIVLIDRLVLEFGPGLTVLTGETGAGKSILLDALGLALGRKGRGDPVRAGAEGGSVEAVFDIPADHAANARLADLGIETENEIILRRVVSAAGPSRAFVNDRRVSADTLRDLGAVLVEAHGQHDDRLLLDPAGHRAILDAFAGHDAALSATREGWEDRRKAETALETARDTLARAERDREWLEHVVAELEAFDPQEGEDDALDAERRRLRAAEQVGEAVAQAAQEISQGAEQALADALRRLERAAEKAGDLLTPALDALDRASREAAEATAAVETAQEALRFDPDALNHTEERLFALRALARKHDCGPDELSALTRELSARLAALAGGAQELTALEAAARRARESYDAAAAALSAARAEAAMRLAAGVAEELPALKLESATFLARLIPCEPGPEGMERVSFEVAANPGAKPGPIGAVASGGELSRLLLALKARLSARAAGLTMIFDEIDRGVGGATAEAVGRRLKRLSEGGGQVLVVTHSPQVAAQGGRHLKIEKRASADETRVSITELASDQRREEIARMLAGEQITAAAREAAAALMD